LPQVVAVAVTVVAVAVQAAAPVGLLRQQFICRQLHTRQQLAQVVVIWLLVVHRL
jgi:hypothetical protein